MSQIKITPANANGYFYIEPLSARTRPPVFQCAIDEYTEKELHGLNYPFKTVPALKIAKLAVDTSFAAQYRGIGSFMIQTAERLAYGLNNEYIAARFLTVDADIEHDAGVLVFYEKNGFITNAELYNKNRKTISMRKDIYS